MDERSPVDLSSSAVVFRHDRVLLVCRRRDGYWALPGGTPRPGEGVAACVRREVSEETGLGVQPGGCVFVLETIDPESAARVINLVFLAEADGESGSPKEVEDDLLPSFVRLAELGALSLRPPLAGHLRALHADPRRPSAAYLGNLWRAHLQDSHEG
jgi:ADP-ribose pyrophosphatase YjhB (NUDIX family)